MCASRRLCALAVDSAVLVLVHCVPVSFAERSVGLDDAVNRGYAVLGDCLRGLAEDGLGVSTRTRLVRIHPHELGDDELDADLVVVGGSRVGQETSLGSVARGVIRNAPCPVLLVPRR